jgi:hypothetical protein
MLSSIFNKNPQYYRKNNEWPITPLPLWTKPIISKEMLDKYLIEKKNNSNSQSEKE